MILQARGRVGDGPRGRRAHLRGVDRDFDWFGGVPAEVLLDTTKTRGTPAHRAFCS